jgi:hypothetical protein
MKPYLRVRTQTFNSLKFLFYNEYTICSFGQ